MSAPVVVVVGLGAIGTAVAAALMQVGQTPVLVSRTQVKQLEVRIPGGSFKANIECLTEPTPILVDVMILAVKAHQTASASPWLRAMSPSTVFILQNGVEHVARVGRHALPNTELVPVVVSIPAIRLTPGVVTVSGEACLTAPRGDTTDQLSHLLARSFIAVSATDDWTTAAWEKLMENAAFGGLGVLGRTSNRDLCADRGLRRLLVLLMSEVAAVGRAAGAHVPGARVQEMLEDLCGRATDKVSSIAVDRLSGVASEWDARNGVVGRLGRRYGVPTPVSDWVTELIRLGEPPFVAPVITQHRR